jgi:hypothetical protein
LIFFLAASLWSKAETRLSTDRLAAGTKKTEKKFRLTSDKDWRIETEKAWISVSPQKGKAGTHTLTAAVLENSDFSERTACIKVITSDTVIKLTVNQVDSENYWKNGDLITLNSAGQLPPGRKPIPIVIIGDGWDLSDLRKGGLWETFARALSDLFLEIDVVRDFRDYFDIYAYCAESNHRGIHGFNAFGTTTKKGTDFKKMRRLINKALKNHPNRKAMTFISASNGKVGGWASVEGYAFVSNPDSTGTYAYWMAHEFIGHGFGQIPDFYPCWGCGTDFSCDTLDRNSPPVKDKITRRGGYYPKSFTNGKNKVKALVKRTYRAWNAGFEWNVDWETDPERVVWKDFIGREGYENVGVFPTEFNDWGDYNCWYYGLTTPEQDDCMVTSAYVWFNVGSRIWLWNKILKYTGVPDPNLLENPDPEHPRSLENFMKFDAEHGYNRNGQRSPLPEEHPVLTGKYWIENNLYPQ